MSAPTTTSHPYDHARRYPDGEGSIPVDWSERLGENMDGWESRETVDRDGHTLVAGMFGAVYGAVVDGTFYDCQDVRDRADEEDYERETTDDEDSDEDSEEDPDDEPGPWRTLADVLDDAEDDSGAEGPMMNSFYLLERGGYGGRSIDLAQWAAKLDGLPLCAVELDGDYGLALTGGGMDLSWEIAEAHLRLGYRVPTWLTLPQMADGRMSGETLSERQRAIVRAAIRDQRAAAQHHATMADRLAERYGITETVED